MAIMSKVDFFLKSMTDNQKIQVVLLEQKVQDTVSRTEHYCNLEIDIRGFDSKVINVVRTSCIAVGWEVDIIDWERMILS
jgi:hypothetical protein